MYNPTAFCDYAAGFSVPVGFYFHPTDSDLLGFYLSNKVWAKCCHTSLLPHVDLYASSEPWNIWQRFHGDSFPKGEDLYFFTTLKRTSSSKGGDKKGTRVSRKAGSGCWHEEHTSKVSDPKNEGRHLGFCKRFHYKNANSIHDHCWLMHEYSLLEYPSNTAKEDNGDQFVLCRLRKNHQKIEKNEKKRKFNATAAAPEKNPEDFDTPIVQSIRKSQRTQEQQPSQSQPEFFTANMVSPLASVPQTKPQSDHVELIEIHQPSDIQYDFSQLDNRVNDALMTDYSCQLDTRIDGNKVITESTTEQQSLAQFSNDQKSELNVSHFNPDDFLNFDGDDALQPSFLGMESCTAAAAATQAEGNKISKGNVPNFQLLIDSLLNDNDDEFDSFQLYGGDALSNLWGWTATSTTEAN